jgi:hypothetical protein
VKGEGIFKWDLSQATPPHPKKNPMRLAILLNWPQLSGERNGRGMILMGRRI